MTQRIGFGGGCHWCTEAVFQALRGVGMVDQGFVRSHPPDDSFSEAVIVHFDPDIIALEVLIDIHLRTHASTSDHKMRGKYRSAIYTFSDEQARTAKQALQTYAPDFDAPLVTRVLRHAGFKPSDERFQDYYRTDPERAFCKRYIDPKLDLLRARFSRALA